MRQPERTPPPGSAFLIPSRKAFLEALDLDRPALAPVRDALTAGRIDEAATAFIQRFRTREITCSLLKDWSAIEHQADGAPPQLR